MSFVIHLFLNFYLMKLDSNYPRRPPAKVAKTDSSTKQIKKGFATARKIRILIVNASSVCILDAVQRFSKIFLKACLGARQIPSEGSHVSLKLHQNIQNIPRVIKFTRNYTLREKLLRNNQPIELIIMFGRKQSMQSREVF